MPHLRYSSRTIGEVLHRVRLQPDCVWRLDHRSSSLKAPRLEVGNPPGHIAERVLNARVAMEGERKSVSVLFADLKGSTEFIQQLDPEEAHIALDPILQNMVEAVHKSDGIVSKLMGDGLMALFGAPLALEDHAVRACYAALRIRDSFKHLRTRPLIYECAMA